MREHLDGDRTRCGRKELYRDHWPVTIATDFVLTVLRQLNLGVYNGLKAQRVLNSQYWIGTHDEIKQGRGLVGYFIKRDVQSIKDALEQEKRQRQNGNDASTNSEYDEVLASFDDTRWLDLRNGESRVLS